MYVLALDDTNFELSLQFAFPAWVETEVLGNPPQFHDYNDYVQSVLSEYGEVVSQKQHTDEKSIWQFSDGTKIICQAKWIPSIDDPYDVNTVDDFIDG